MTLAAWLTLATLIAVLVVLATDRVSPSMTLLVVVSLLTDPSPREKWEPFFQPPPEDITAGAEATGEA